MRVSDVDIPVEQAVSLTKYISEADDEAIIDTLRQMMLTSELTLRAPRSVMGADGRLLNDYVKMPDWRARGWAAVRLAEIKFGRPKQQIDVKVSGRIGGPISRADAARELMQDWNEIKRIGDDYVGHLKQALPAAPDGQTAQSADVELLDIDLPE